MRYRPPSFLVQISSCRVFMSVTSIHAFELKAVRREKVEIVGVDMEDAELVILKVIMQTRFFRFFGNF